jgi:hypothetical protein
MYLGFFGGKMNAVIWYGMGWAEVSINFHLSGGLSVGRCYTVVGINYKGC